MHPIRINEHSEWLMGNPKIYGPELALELKADAREIRRSYKLEIAPIDTRSAKSAFAFMAHKLDFPKSLLENGKFGEAVLALEKEDVCDALVLLGITGGAPSSEQFEKMISAPFGKELGMQLLDFLSNMYEQKMGGAVSKTGIVRMLDAFSYAVRKGIGFSSVYMPEKGGNERKTVLQSVALSAMELVRYDYDDALVREAALRTMQNMALSGYLGKNHAEEFAETVAFHHLAQGKNAVDVEWQAALKKQEISDIDVESAFAQARKRFEIFNSLPHLPKREIADYSVSRRAMKEICKWRMFSALREYRVGGNIPEIYAKQA